LAQADDATIEKVLPKRLVDDIIRIALIALLVVMCARIIAPFIGLILWALILAIALNPLYRRVSESLGGRQGVAATLLVVAGLLLIGVPTAMLGSSFANHLYGVYTAIENNAISIQPPAAAVADWPIIGNKVHAAWSAAANDLPAYLEQMQPQLKRFATYILSVVRNTAGGLLVFLGALIIAGIVLTYGESGGRTMQRMLERVTGPVRGPRLTSLSIATIRSVASGVIGVACIQALLLGVGFFLAGIPAAGLLALIVVLVGIAQLPAAIVSIPVIAYLWWAGDASTISNVMYTVYLLLAGLADNVLKPLLLGRGVDAPMPVILLGALGGMVSTGIIGLFVGAVVLAVGYRLFTEWLDRAQDDASAQPPVSD
jgi:predicted PurR-regulated permease PerM